MAKKLEAHAISHNDVGDIDRGVWRKYNPYNPYVPEDDKKKQVDNLKVESLDDLFDEPEEPKKEEKVEVPKEAKLDELKIEPIQIEKSNDAPILPQDNSEDDELDIDLQKELEAKFDELFGPLEDDN